MLVIGRDDLGEALWRLVMVPGPKAADNACRLTWPCRTNDAEETWPKRVTQVALGRSSEVSKGHYVLREAVYNGHPSWPSSLQPFAQAGQAF